MADRRVGSVYVEVGAKIKKGEPRKTLAKLKKKILSQSKKINVKIGVDAGRVLAKTRAISKAISKTTKPKVNLEINDKKALAQAEAISKAIFRKSPTINPKINNKEAIAQARALIQKIQGSHTPKIDIDLNTTKALKDAKSFQKILEQDKVQIKAFVNPEINRVQAVSKVISEINSISKTVSKSPKTEIEMKPVLEKAGFKYDLDDLIEDAEKRDIDLKAQLQAAEASARMRALTRDRAILIYAHLNKASVAKIQTQLESLSGFRFIRQRITNLFDMIRDLDKTLPTFTAFSYALSAIGSGGITGIVNLYTVLSDIVSIGPAMLALPGIFTAVGASAVIIGSAMVDAKKRLKGVGDEFSKLQDKISDSFWDQAEKPIRKLVKKVLPALESRLVKISKKLGKTFGSTADYLKSSSAIKDLQGFLDGFSDSIDLARGGIKAFTEAFVKLLDVGGSKLPELAKWFTKVGKSFRDWVNEAAADGRLSKWIDEGVFKLQELWRAVVNLWGVFRELNEIMTEAGGSSLTNFADGLERVKNALSEGKWRDGLIEFFQGLRNTFDAMVPGISNLADAWLEAIPAFNEVGLVIGEGVSSALTTVSNIISNSDFQEGLKSMFEGISNGIQAVSPHSDQLASIFGEIMETAGTLGENFGEVAAVALEELGPSLENLLETVQVIAPALKDKLVAAMEKLGPLIEDLTEKIKDFSEENPDLAADIILVSAAVSLLVNKIFQLIGAFDFLPATFTSFTSNAGGASGSLGALGIAARLLGGPLGRVLGIVGLVAGAIMYLWNNSEDFREGVKKLGDTLSEKFDEVWTALQPLFDALGKLFDTLMENFQKLIEKLLPVLIPALEVLIDVLGDQFISTIEKVTGFLEGFTQIFDGILTYLVGTFTGDWEMIWEGVVKTVEGIKTTIVEVFNNLWNDAGAVLQGMVDGLGAILSESWDGMWDNEFTAVVKDNLDKVTGFLADLPKKVYEFFGQVQEKLVGLVRDFNNFSTNAKKAFDDTVSKIKNAFVNGFNTIVSNVGNTLTGMVTSIGTNLSNGYNKFNTWVSNVKNKLVSGASGWISNIVSTVTGLPGKVLAALGNVGNTLFNSGKSLIGGFTKGIKSAISSAVNAASGAVSQVRAYFPFSPAKEGPFSGRGYVTYSGKALMEDFAGSLDKYSSAPIKSISGTLSDMNFTGETPEFSGSSTVTNNTKEYQNTDNSQVNINLSLPEHLVGSSLQELLNWYDSLQREGVQRGWSGMNRSIAIR